MKEYEIKIRDELSQDDSYNMNCPEKLISLEKNFKKIISKRDNPS